MIRWIFPRRSLVAMVLVVLAGAASTAAFAQGVTPDPNILSPDSPNRIAPPYLERVAAPIRNVTPSRLRNMERREFEVADLERRRLDMSDREIREDVGDQLETAGVICGVRNIKRVGTTPEAQSIYEAACTDGPGYVLINGMEPKATNCLALSGAAASARRRDPNAEAGAQCTLPENQNGLQLISGWAREAGVDCRIDQAEWLGPAEDGSDIYEVGCDGSEGFWLEQAASGWTLTGCIELNAAGLNCQFTQATEQYAWMRARLAGTPAEACDVSEIRLIGASSQGRHYETRCNASDQGFLFRLARDGQAEDVTLCTGQEDCILTADSRLNGQA